MEVFIFNSTKAESVLIRALKDTIHLLTFLALSGSRQRNLPFGTIMHGRHVCGCNTA